MHLKHFLFLLINLCYQQNLHLKILNGLLLKLLLFLFSEDSASLQIRVLISFLFYITKTLKKTNKNGRLSNCGHFVCETRQFLEFARKSTISISNRLIAINYSSKNTCNTTYSVLCSN